MAVQDNKKFTRTICRRFRCRSSRTGSCPVGCTRSNNRFSKDLGPWHNQPRQSFETAEQFKARQDLFAAQQRAALGFEQRQQALAGLAPQVAGLSGREQRS